MALGDYGVPGCPAPGVPGGPGARRAGGAVTVLARAARRTCKRSNWPGARGRRPGLCGARRAPHRRAPGGDAGLPGPLPHTAPGRGDTTRRRAGPGRTVAIVPALLDGAGAARIPGGLCRGRPRAAPRRSTGLLTGSAGARAVPRGGQRAADDGWAVGRYLVERRRRAGAALTSAYEQLQEHYKAQRWAEARQAIESIRAIAPGYRDVPLLDTRVREEEAASWRREHLFHEGVEAYRQRNWRAAAHVFAVIEREDPYYRDVRFLHRTAMLYADLRSRDRSRRVGAARQLGEVGDLVEWAPLLEALGDPRAGGRRREQFFSASAPGPDVLLGGLRPPERRCAPRHAPLKGTARPSASGSRRVALERPAIRRPSPGSGQFGARREITGRSCGQASPTSRTSWPPWRTRAWWPRRCSSRRSCGRAPTAAGRPCIAALKARADIAADRGPTARTVRTASRSAGPGRARSAVRHAHLMARTAGAGDAASRVADSPRTRAPRGGTGRGRWLRLFDGRLPDLCSLAWPRMGHRGGSEGAWHASWQWMTTRPCCVIDRALSMAGHTVVAERSSRRRSRSWRATRRSTS